MRLSTKIAFNIQATVINIVIGLLRNKISAAFLTINLFGILSIGQQSTSLLYTIFAFGFPLGITTLSSRFVDKSLEEQIAYISRLVVLVGIVAGAVGVILTAVLLIAPVTFARLITSSTEYVLPISVLSLASPLMVFENCLYAVLEGMGKLREIVMFKIVPGLLALPIIYILTSQYGLVGASFGFLTSELLLAVTGFILLRDFVRIDRRAWDVRDVFVGIIKVAILSFTVGLGWLASDFLVKRYVLGELGEVENGIIQSVAKVTDLYPMVALSWLSMHLFPTISSSGGDRIVIARAIERTALVAVALVVPIILILFAFRPFVLELIYRKDFAIASDYFGAMLATGIPKVVSWVLGVGVLAMGLRRQWFYSSMLMTVVYVLGAGLGLVFHRTIYALPVMLGLGLCVQTAYALFVYRAEGVGFEPAFAQQMSMLTILTGVLVGAVFSQWFLVPGALLYFAFVHRFKLLDEVKNRLYARLRKAT